MVKKGEIKMKTIITAIILSLLVAGVAQAEFFDFPSESICKDELAKLKIVVENSSDIRYCQSEKNGTEIYCKKTNGKIALAMCSGKTLTITGF